QTERRIFLFFGLCGCHDVLGPQFHDGDVRRETVTSGVFNMNSQLAVILREKRTRPYDNHQQCSSRSPYDRHIHPQAETLREHCATVNRRNATNGAALYDRHFMKPVGLPRPISAQEAAVLLRALEVCPVVPISEVLRDSVSSLLVVRQCSCGCDTV